MKYASEADLAKDVVRWLMDQGWDVYEEVEVYSGGSRADIVAVQGGLYWVIETKLLFGLSVIAQARSWVWQAHAVSVAVPSGKASAARALGEKLCRDFGIGVLYASSLDDEFEWAAGRWGEIPPRLQRRADTRRLAAALTEEHKNYRAGTQGQYHTRWKSTRDAVLQVTKRRPGITMRELVEALDHHYHSDALARRLILGHIRSGLIEGLRVDTTKRPYRIYPEETNAQGDQPTV